MDHLKLHFLDRTMHLSVLFFFFLNLLERLQREEEITELYLLVQIKWFLGLGQTEARSFSSSLGFPVDAQALGPPLLLCQA